jgi:hypothetical protein
MRDLAPEQGSGATAGFSPHSSSWNPETHPTARARARAQATDLEIDVDLDARSSGTAGQRESVSSDDPARHRALPRSPPSPTGLGKFHHPPTSKFNVHCLPNEASPRTHAHQPIAHSCVHPHHLHSHFEGSKATPPTHHSSHRAGTS